MAQTLTGCCISILWMSHNSPNHPPVSDVYLISKFPLVNLILPWKFAHKTFPAITSNSKPSNVLGWDLVIVIFSSSGYQVSSTTSFSKDAIRDRSRRRAKRKESMDGKPRSLMHNLPWVLSYQEIFLQTLTPQNPVLMGRTEPSGWEGNIQGEVSSDRWHDGPEVMELRCLAMT